jgi:2-octaprenyl-6-methoxyphenol hydroxylase
VQALKALPDGVEVDAGIADTFDLAVVAEGGVFAEQINKTVHNDYQQTAWVGTVGLTGTTTGMAFERFTRQGPAALLPLPPAPDGQARAALVWCVQRDDDPVQALTDAEHHLSAAGRAHHSHLTLEEFCAWPERRTHLG